MHRNETVGLHSMEREQKVEREFHRSPAVRRLLVRSLDIRSVRRKCTETARLMIDSK